MQNKRYKLVEKNTGDCLLPDVESADSLTSRLSGLIGRASIPAGYGLYFPGCGRSLTCFMSCPIEIIYVDRALTAIKLVRHIRPWRFSFCFSASGVIETGSGWIDEKKIAEGMQLLLTESGESC